MRFLAIESLGVRHLRNLSHVDLEPSPHFNVIAGDNGSGKTSLLEALYLVATSKSFRASRPGEAIQHEQPVASVRAMIRESTELREQSIGLRAGARAVRIDGKRPPTLAAYAVQTPAVVFHPGVLSLSMAGGAERRKLLDRIGLYLWPASLDAAESYVRALRARQKILEVRGPTARELHDYEELLVRHGLALVAVRHRAAVALAESSESAFREIAPAGSELRLVYEATAPTKPDEYLVALVQHRVKDQHRGSSSIGPHRDDLALSLNGIAMRGVASQGQHRAAVLALKLGEIEVIAKARATRPILLLDDFSSELDRHRNAALLHFLRAQSGQVFLTTTRPELIDFGANGPSLRRDFVASRGTISLAT